MFSHARRERKLKINARRIWKIFPLVVSDTSRVIFMFVCFYDCISRFAFSSTLLKIYVSMKRMRRKFLRIKNATWCYVETFFGRRRFFTSLTRRLLLTALWRTRRKNSFRVKFIQSGFMSIVLKKKVRGSLKWP